MCTLTTDILIVAARHAVITKPTTPHIKEAFKHHNKTLKTVWSMFSTLLYIVDFICFYYCQALFKEYIFCWFFFYIIWTHRLHTTVLFYKNVTVLVEKGENSVVLFLTSREWSESDLNTWKWPESDLKKKKKTDLGHLNRPKCLLLCYISPVFYF